MLEDLGQRIQTRLEQYGIRADQSQVHALEHFVGHLAKWNAAINLTALDLGGGLEKSLDRLVVEPFLAAQAIPQFAGSRIIDLGSGGGSPGIPLAIALRTTDLSLVESKTKKASFLRDVLRLLSWPRARVLQARMENIWTDDTLRGTSEVISIRQNTRNEAGRLARRREYSGEWRPLSVVQVGESGIRQHRAPQP